MDTPSALSTELLDAVRICLDAGKFKEALELPNDNKYAASLKDNCWDLIPHLISRLKDDTIITWPALQRCCERLLLVIADKANPKEVLLELIEQAETAKNDAQFIATLLPMQNVLKRLSKKRGRSLEWVLNTLHSYIEQLPLPDNYDLSKEEKLVMDCDTNVRRILKIYTELSTFYDHFVDELCKSQKNKLPAKDVLVCFLIDLLGKPLALLDMESNGKTSGQCRIHADSIFRDICRLEPNLYRFLQYIETKCNPNKRSVLKNGVYEDAPDDIFLLDEKLSPISLGVLYYLLLAEKLTSPMIPQVYCPQFICQEVLSLASLLLAEEANMIKFKGTRLARAILELYPDKFPASLLSSPAHPALARALSTAAVYCPSELLRKEAVVILKEYILKFNDEGRYLVIVNLLPTLDHAGIIGYVIMIYKEVLNEALTEGGQRILWFSDHRLHGVLSKICHLKNGTETDLVESADHLISSLNFLRYLVLKDNEDATGIWKQFSNIQKHFLIPLREALDMSRAHYEVSLMNIVNNKEDDEANHAVALGYRWTPAALAQTRCVSTNNHQQNEESNSSQSDNESSEEKAYVDDIKNTILRSSLEFVGEEGWTKEALGRGAQAAGYVSTVHSLLPHGPSHLVHYFTVTCNSQLADQMEKMLIPNKPPNPVKFIEDSIALRLAMLEIYKNSWGDALGTVMSGGMAVEQIKAILTLADDICYFAGDRSVDTDWYARRAVVASIYQASELHWVGGGKNTQEFTSTHLQRAVALRKIPENLSALFKTASNMLALNQNK